MIAEKIKKLRTDTGLSQEDLARLMNVSRPTLSQIELGERALKVDDVHRLADIFEIPAAELLETNQIASKQERKNDPHAKLKNLILYILGKCGQKPNVWEIVLNKLLYFCDFNYYEHTFDSITGTQYIKYPRWPVPQDMKQVLEEMESDGLIKRFDVEYFGFTQKKGIPLMDPDMMSFNGKQIEVIEQVIAEYSDKNGKWLTDFSHEDMPWKATKEMMQPIEYGLVFHRSPVYSVTHDEEL